LQHYLVAMATSLDKLEKKAIDSSSAPNVLSYGVKIAKMGLVDPEILNQISAFFGRVIPDVHK